MTLDGNADLEYVCSLLEESYRLVAPRGLVKRLEEERGAEGWVVGDETDD